MRRQKTRVLVVDRDLLFLQLLTRYLQLEGYDVSPVSDGQQAIEQVARYAPDLVLLDVASQAPDALRLCQRVRERSQAPIVCITAARPQEKGELLKLGADDYLCQPFDADELLAHRQVLYAGHATMLAPREYRLLACLAQHAGRLVSQELLLQYVWGNEYAGKRHLLQVTIKRLRRKLEPDAARPRFPITKSSKDCGVSYLLTCPN